MKSGNGRSVYDYPDESLPCLVPSGRLSIAVQLLNQLGIRLHGGAPTLPVDEIVSRYLAGTMIYGDATCHHDNCGGDHHHHE